MDGSPSSSLGARGLLDRNGIHPIAGFEDGFRDGEPRGCLSSMGPKSEAAFYFKREKRRCKQLAGLSWRAGGRP